MQLIQLWMHIKATTLNNLHTFFPQKNKLDSFYFFPEKLDSWSVELLPTAIIHTRPENDHVQKQDILICYDASPCEYINAYSTSVDNTPMTYRETHLTLQINWHVKNSKLWKGNMQADVCSFEQKSSKTCAAAPN